ncbi:MAG: hypothetical protein WC610_04215 [Patescibacteria group bacterium]
MDSSSLQKFSQLPLAIRNKLSAPEFLGVIEDLEKQYRIKLTMVFIALVVGDISFNQISDYLKNKYNINQGGAEAINKSLIQLLENLKRQFPAEFRGAVANKAAFAFAVEDEEEINKFKNLSIISDGQKYNYGQLADLIIGESAIGNDDEVLTKRLHNIIFARLKGVRDDLETKDALIKSRKIGGVELAEDLADKIMKLINDKLSRGLLKKDFFEESKEVKFEFPIKKPFLEGKINLREKFQSSPKNNLAAPAYNLSPPSSANFIPPKTEPRPLERELKKENLLYIKEEGGLPVIQMPEDGLMPQPRFLDLNQSAGATALAENQKVYNIVSQTKENIVVGLRPSPRPIPQPVKTMMPPKMMDNQLSRKPKLDDVRFARRLVGPTEELGNMTLIDFRRISENPREATKKIKEKIGLLERESYGKRLEGIEAWHGNEVNKFYRLLGQKCLAEARGIEAVINERLNNNKPTLSLEEFNAIMELNRELRF